jgi:hypothetical protein
MATHTEELRTVGGYIGLRNLIYLYTAGHINRRFSSGGTVHSLLAEHHYVILVGNSYWVNKRTRLTMPRILQDPSTNRVVQCSVEEPFTVSLIIIQPMKESCRLGLCYEKGK